MERIEYLLSFLDYETMLLVIPAAILCYIPMRNQRRRKARWDVLWCALILFFSAITLSWIVSGFPKLDGTVALVPFLGIFFVYYAMSVRAHVSQCAGIFLVTCAFFSIPCFIAYIADAYMNSPRGENPNPHVFTATGSSGMCWPPPAPLSSLFSA